MLPMIPQSDPRALADLARRCGFPITVRDAAMLLQTHADSLRSTGRIEIEGGGPEALIEAFASSPYLEDTETLCRLTELFFHLKNASDDHIYDELLLRRMAECFDDCRGSIELTYDRLEGGTACLR